MDPMEVLEPPERQIQVTMILCDYAQVAAGKLNIIGGGGTWTGPQPVPFGIATPCQGCPQLRSRA
jgi:hypothetical protein